ncbi:MAG: nitronate monooxygenase [Verrucomicrobiota bacterium]|jgi:nitronate monooxygenase
MFTRRKVHDFLGTSLPIIQAPMAGVQGSALAVSVCNAGGLGSLPCAMLSPDPLRRQLVEVTSQTSQPYNVNFFCHVPPKPHPGRDAEWRKILAPYYREFGIDAESIPPGPVRAPFSHEAADVLSEFKPPVVSFHFGLPAPDLLARVQAWHPLVLSSATTVQEARWLESHGADAIIAQGLEAGGHRGHFLSSDLSEQMGTFALVPRVKRAVNIPVIAAGGIADARGVAAALALGATAAQIGTAYLLCHESTTSPVHRAAIKSEAGEHTALTNLFSGGAARGIMNRLMRDLGPMSNLAPCFPLAAAALAPLRAIAESRGLGDFSPLWSGQNTNGCRDMPAAQLTKELYG